LLQKLKVCKPTVGITDRAIQRYIGTACLLPILTTGFLEEGSKHAASENVVVPIEGMMAFIVQ